MANNTIINWVIVILLIIAGICLWLYFASPGQAPTANNNTTSHQNAITSFKFLGLNPTTEGVVDTADYTIELTVPNNIDVVHLVPTIGISPGASVWPQSGVQQDFTQPVIYRVTAQDGSIQSYTVTVLMASVK